VCTLLSGESPGSERVLAKCGLSRTGRACPASIDTATSAKDFLRNLVDTIDTPRLYARRHRGTELPRSAHDEFVDLIRNSPHIGVSFFTRLMTCAAMGWLPLAQMQDLLMPPLL